MIGREIQQPASVTEPGKDTEGGIVTTSSADNATKSARRAGSNKKRLLKAGLHGGPQRPAVLLSDD